MFETCIQCGCCQESCYLENKGIRSFASVPLEGADQVNIWMCSNCWVCQDQCPQGVPLMEYKKQLQRQRPKPYGWAEGIRLIAQCGFCLPIDLDSLNEFRVEVGLEPITGILSSTIKHLLR